MDSLSRDLVKSFAEVVNEPKQKEPVRYVRGTITGKGDAKYVQLDGSTVATPISEVVDAQEGDRVLVSIENHRAVIVGNFTFSPSARQEQEALEKAEGAENTANSAGETANAAQLAAQEASKNANEAMGAASAASASAAEAKDQAADAMVAAGNAQASANEAKESATQANENATQAKTDAANAQAAVANANEEIGKINDAIETAQGDINQALDDLYSQADEINVIKRDYSTKVETENVKAELSTQITESVGQLQTTIQQNYYTKNDIVEIRGNLQSQITQNAEGLSSQATKIESLESDTAEAQKQVDQALEKAESAQQAATQAKQDAEAATEAAETAQTEATTAAEKAQNANDAALDAKLAAHVADKALADAREALDQARENYKNVVSNPGSTAEDIASAAAQVETARQAVETALEDAAEAQYVANKAQEAADVAQEEANAASQAAQTAQNKADAAEQAANNAQAAAEQAAEDVAALTKRVTTAETKIDQNAEQISLNATKTEEIGDKLVNDYYSKTETDALIKVESDRITSTVSKVETVEKTAITSTIEEFYLSSSPTALSGGSWVTTQPTWTQGKYIWRRTKVTKGDGSTSYSPSQNGVCITGNTGEPGKDGADGTDGTPGKDGVSIQSIQEKYAVSSSNSTPPNSWSDEVPNMTPTNKYLWNYEIITYSDKRTETTSKRVIGAYGNTGPQGPAGADGADGKPGATGSPGANGVGIKTITNYYLVSSQNTGITVNTSGWTTTPPTTTTTNKYLWNYEAIAYTNGNVVKGTPKIIGTHGATGPQGPNGANGISISKTEVFYYLSTSSTTQIGGSWVTAPPAWVSGKYYWQKIKTTFSNGSSSESTPVCITGAKGQNGSTGAAGQSVTSVTAEYYLSTSKTTQTGGSWINTIPTWSSGKYLWIRNKILYANPAKTEYTTPYCDSSWEAVDEIEIGGRNLLRNTNFEKQLSNKDYGVMNNAYILSIDNNGYNKSKCLKVVGKVVGSAANCIRMYTTVQNEINTEYVFSGYIKGDKVTELAVRFGRGSSEIPIVSVGTDWKYFSVVVKSGTQSYGELLPYLKTIATVYFSQIKLEKGNKATDWTPAPEDVDSKFDDVYESINEVETNATSLINQTAESINTEVSKKVGKDEIISSINQTAESIKIQASKIKLEGLVTANENFKILADGSIESVNGKFIGTVNANSGTVAGWTIKTNSLQCTSYNEGFDITYTTYIDANNGLIKFMSSASEYETIVSLNGMEMHTEYPDGDGGRIIYRDVYYGIEGIKSSGNTAGGDFSLTSEGVSFGDAINLTGWANEGGVLRALGPGKLTNINAINGYKIGGRNSNTNRNIIPVIAGDGVMEVGTCIDFHPGTSPADYSPRITANTSGLLTLSGGLKINGELSFNPSGVRIYGQNVNGSNNIYLNADSGYGALYSRNNAIYFNLAYVDANWSMGKFYPGKAGACALGGTNNWYRLYAKYNTTVSSDRRLKENIVYFNDMPRPYNNDDSVIDVFFKSLKPSSFNLKDDEYKRLKFGFIAQDVIESLENIGLTAYDVDFVSHGRDENGNISEDAMYGLCYEEFVSLNTHMIQKAFSIIEKQNEEISKLKEQLSRII